MALSGVRAHCTGSWCLALLVLLGDLAMEERNKLLFGKHLLPGGKTGAQTHGFPQPPRGDLLKGTLKDLLVLKERNEGKQGRMNPMTLQGTEAFGCTEGDC